MPTQTAQAAKAGSAAGRALQRDRVAAAKHRPGFAAPWLARFLALSVIVILAGFARIGEARAESAGCATINSGALSFARVLPGSEQRSMAAPFETGETIKLVLSRSTLQTVAISLDASPSGKVSNADATDGATLSVTIGSDASHTVTSEIAGNFETGASVTITCTPAFRATTTSLASAPNPSPVGQEVTFTATVAPSGGGIPMGNVVLTIDGVAMAPIALDASGRAVVRSSSLTAGDHRVTAAYAGGQGYLASTSPVMMQTVRSVSTPTATATVLASSKNPSKAGEAVTFTATVSGGSGTPTGIVTFFDGATAIGSGTLSAGVATLQTILALGTHSITAAYGGTAGFDPSRSPVLHQKVAIPEDSTKLRDLQILMTQAVAQTSGQAISGAIDGAVSEGFEDGSAPVSADADGIRLNLIAGPSAQGSGSRDSVPSLDPQDFEERTADKDGKQAIDVALGNVGPASGYATAPIQNEPHKWRIWADIRNTQWRSSDKTGNIDGGQINAITGITYKFTPDLLAGFFGGYETFDYTSDPLDGRLTGNGWTAGAYFGWRPLPGLRFDAGAAHSLIDYSGSAGTADGVFDGRRWLFQSGLTGSRTVNDFEFEPSARVYTLWEQQDAYTDSLGTPQAERSFSTGRASGGIKVTYPFPMADDFKLSPYAGIYGDYYFSHDDAGLVLTLADAVADGWSARFVGGIRIETSAGIKASLSGEIGGLGSGGGTLGSVRARLSAPF